MGLCNSYLFPILAAVSHLLQTAGVRITLRSRSPRGYDLRELGINRSLYEVGITLSPEDHDNGGNDARSNTDPPATFATMPLAKSVAGLTTEPITRTGTAANTVALLFLPTVIDVIFAVPF